MILSQTRINTHRVVLIRDVAKRVWIAAHYDAGVQVDRTETRSREVADYKYEIYKLKAKGVL